MVNTNTPRIERAVTKLYVPHKNREIAFVSPAYGSNNYQYVGKEILKNGLKVPTGDYTASLVHPAYCNSEVSNEPEFKNVRDIMRSNWLWVFNQNFWTPEGVYVVCDLEAKGRSKTLDLSRLEKAVNAKGIKEVSGVRFSKDKKVRFAPKETYRLGKHTSESLSKDGFVIAGYNVDGAKKLAEVASKLPNIPLTYGVEVSDGNAPKLSLSSLNEYDDRLHISGGGWCDYDSSHAFGVF